MSEDEEPAKIGEAQRFREAYRGCADEKRVSPERSPSYGRWVKGFAGFLPESLVQKAVKQAAGRTAITRKVSCHTLSTPLKPIY